MTAYKKPLVARRMNSIVADYLDTVSTSSSTTSIPMGPTLTAGSSVALMCGSTLRRHGTHGLTKWKHGSRSWRGKVPA
jgi:hypothetical protein